ncbi:hypothetical protein L1I79_19860 [Strepomyces sp. STD 3.1]|nr:hypothetical protein [Streptomyces sp. STD 3.1]
MARTGVVLVRNLTRRRIAVLRTAPCAGPRHGRRGRRRPDTASGSPYDPGSRHSCG